MRIFDIHNSDGDGNGNGIFAIVWCGLPIGGAGCAHRVGDWVQLTWGYLPGVWWGWHLFGCCIDGGGTAALQQWEWDDDDMCMML